MKSKAAVHAFLVIAFILASSDLTARTTASSGQDRDIIVPSRVLVVDGSPVHDVGELLIHMANWGMAGSMPLVSSSFSQAPSGEWPAGSGVEHLFAAGLWVGAIKSGVPAVSTAVFQIEFRPTEDPVDIVYRSSEGAPGGIRSPFPGADDDSDGLVDEDRLDGHDNDGDGLVDEDFAAISDQMFSCWYTDDQPAAIQAYPEHNPLHITVREQSYQWADDGFDDFVGVEYEITNTGSDMLQDVYVGIFADCDVGRRSVPNYWEDDAAGFMSTPAVCTPHGSVPVDVAYSYDADGDEGQTTSYFGVVLLDHPTDPSGNEAPPKVRVTTYASFFGDAPFEEGGDPTNDFERYELMSLETIQRDLAVPRDYRQILVVGPFASLPPESTIVVRFAFVAGDGFIGMHRNAALARLAYQGRWFDLDSDPTTGVAGRETPVYGPAEDVVIDPCVPGLDQPIDVPEGEVVWINGDCEEEAFRAEACKYGARDTLIYMTGVGGRETNVHWTIGGREPIVTRIAVMDIKPGSYPNPFNVKFFDFVTGEGDGENGADDNGGAHNKNKKERKGGVLPIAILGQEDFSVEDIDLSTVRLEGVEPLPFGRGYEDLGGPTGSTKCPFTSDEPDGYLDLTLKFRTTDIASAISPSGEAPDVPSIQLMLTGELMDGTPFRAFDCIVFVGKGRSHGDDEDDGDEPALLQHYPNPFNPVTRISYYLPRSGRVRLAIYDVNGAVVDVLEQGYRPAGEHAVVWDASGLASGIYFYKLEAGGRAVVKKAVLVK